MSECRICVACAMGYMLMLLNHITLGSGLRIGGKIGAQHDSQPCGIPEQTFQISWRLADG
jgi:hypothetical protein